MMEFLVIVACLEGKGCSEASSVYYKAHPQLQEMVELQEAKLRKHYGSAVFEIAAPMAFLIVGGTGSFKLNENFNLEVKKYTSPTLVFNKGF